MKFREFFTSSGKKVFAGKDAKTNEELVNRVEKEELIFHTKNPGSPFMNIKSKKPSKKDIEETAVFCASKSQDWRDNRNDVLVHYFHGKDIYKEKGMKLGTFGVKKFKVIKVEKNEIEKFLKK